MGHSRLMPWTWNAVLSTWVWHPAWVAASAVLAAGYILALWWCRRTGRRPVGPARVAAFFTGLTLMVFTVSSAFDVYSMALFWVHMIEHLLLIMVVPALLVLGHPLTLLRATLGPQRTDRVLLSWPVSVLLHPLFGLVFYTTVLVGTHLTHFMDQMAMHPWLMGAERVLYVVSGYILLLSLIGNEPIRWRLPQLARVLLILLAMSPDAVVGIVLMQSNDPFPVMLAMRPSWAPPASQDVLTGGGIMWAGGDGLMMVIGLGTVAAIMRGRDRGALLGSWLENIRKTVMAEQLRSAGEQFDAPALDDSEDVDEDQAVLDAYNRMLSRLNGHPERDPAEPAHEQTGH